MPTSAQYSRWKLKTDADSIIIYNRSVNYSKIKELKMTTTIPSNLGAIVNILQNVERYPEWMHGCRSTHPMNLGPDSTACFQSNLNFPRPFSDRVMFLATTIHQDTTTKVVTVITKSFAHPDFRNKDFVVIEDLVNTWVLTPTSGGEVLVESYLFCDPGGNIPAWLANTFVDKGPLKSIQKLRRRLYLPEFRGVVLSGIHD